MNEDNILKEIERFRRELTRVVKDTGMTSKESIKMSKKIDKLLNEYDKNQLR